MKQIRITENAGYRGQDMKWTETFSHTEKTTEKKYLFHFSYEKINAFRPKYTCFFDENAMLSGQEIYVLEIPEGENIDIYDSNEYRVELNTKHNIKYAGYIERRQERKGWEWETVGYEMNKNTYENLKIVNPLWLKRNENKIKVI